jgi:hypothetical protein
MHVSPRTILIIKVILRRVSAWDIFDLSNVNGGAVVILSENLSGRVVGKAKVTFRKTGIGGL